MALFKILRGSASAIDVDNNTGTKPPFVDGYAYFTPDDGRFYIDVQLDEEPPYYYDSRTINGKTIYRIEVESGTWAALNDTKSPIGHHHTIKDIDGVSGGDKALATVLTTGVGSFTDTGSTINVDIHADWAETTSTKASYIKNKPTIINTAITVEDGTHTMFITSPVENGDEVSY